MTDHLTITKDTNISDEKFKEIMDIFDTIDSDGNGFIEEYELQYALEVAGFRMAHFEVRDLIREHDMINKDGRIDFSEFKALYAKLTQDDFGYQALRAVTTRTDVKGYGTRYSHANIDTKHSIREEEQTAFAKWLSRNLADDEDCKHYFPLMEDGSDMYEKCSDGIILCKILNRTAPNLIDERAITKKKKMTIFDKLSNTNLALNSARAVGCSVVNIRPSDIEAGVEHLLLGLLWQIIKVGLLGNINVTQQPELVVLANKGDEGFAELQSMSPEEILKKWVNYHLEQAGCSRRLTNFASDIKDSEIYAHLLHQLTPTSKYCQCHSVDEITKETDLHRRAELVLDNADILDARVFVTPNDIVSENANLNLAFVANLFKNHSGLNSSEVELPEEAISIFETREERTYRNWMNSLGVEPYVNHLYSDLRSGLILLKIFDVIKPGIVDWKKVIMKFHPMRIKFQQLENCNYVIQLGHQCKFSLVGIAGQDIRDGNTTLTLAVVWQLMRAYTLAVLAELAGDGRPIAEVEILHWANSKLADSKLDASLLPIPNFQSMSLGDGLIILHLIDCLKPGTIDFSLVTDSNTPEGNLSNARYAISSARKIGAKVYALPEDITERKQKMIMTIFACLMALDRQE